MQAQLVPTANVLELPVLGPAVHGPLVGDLCDIDKTSSLHPLLGLFPYAEGLAPLGAIAYADDVLTPRVEEMVVGHGAVVAARVDAVFDDLDPATRCNVLVGLLEEEVPVRDAAEEFADVDKVKVIWREGPVQGHVVDLEYAIWRDPFRLYRGEIRADDGCGGILVCSR